MELAQDIVELESGRDPAGLTALVERTGALVNEVVATYRRPALLWSGGKDSTALLHLTRRMGLRLQVVQLRDPWFPEKWAWARWLTEHWQLEVHDLTPAHQLVYEQDGMMALVSRYHIGGGQYLDMPKDVAEYDARQPEEEQLPSICAVEDFLRRPCGEVEFPWDAVLIAHKDADRDPILGAIPLRSDRTRLPGAAADAWFPMKAWTDADVWDYLALHDVPTDPGRYDVPTRASRPGDRLNADVLPACVACIDRRPGAPATVPCPKAGMRHVPNISHAVPYLGTIVADYIAAERPPHQTADDDA